VDQPGFKVSPAQPSLDLTVFITRDGNELITDSRAVAIAFGKRHSDVLRAIERRFRSGRSVITEHARRNFALGSYADGNRQARPLYRMTAKGLSELAMGFSGDDACEVRIRFLNAFEEMAARLERAEKSITQMLHDHSKKGGGLPEGGCALAYSARLHHDTP
jgi:Rha family phage regulatory protein